MSYYYEDEEKELLKEEFLDEKAQKEAVSFVVKDQRNPRRTDSRNSLSASQLRRFFGEFRQLEKRINAQGFDQVKPLIKMVKSKASYAANPSNSKIPRAFKNFLISNINEINSKKDFEAFMLHFEAVVGFYYGMGVSNN